MATLDSIMSWGIPTLLILIAGGFIYTKFIQPWVIPHLTKLWDWLQGKAEEQQMKKQKEITFE